jgi:hypothetical protein
MKKAIVSVIFCAAVVGGAWLAKQVAFGQATEKEESVTVTKSQLERLIDTRVAQLMKGMEPVSDKMILRGDNWHTAIFEGFKYTIYTGPGQFINMQPVPRAGAPRSGVAPQKPAASRPAGN